MTTRAHPRKKRGRGAGRPSAESEADVRGALLDAAGKLFLKHGFDRVTSRQIAAAAGTTPAMIHYYFDNKLGLFRAMLERAMEPFRQLLKASQGQGGVDVHSIVAGHMRTVSANPWIATLIVNEVFAEQGRFRSSFTRDIAAHLLPMLIGLLEQGRAAGRFRSDLDARLAALSLLSLCAFPFMSRPVSEPLLGLKLEGAQLEQLIAHTARLYLGGIEARPRESC